MSNHSVAAREYGVVLLLSILAVYAAETSALLALFMTPWFSAPSPALAELP